MQSFAERFELTLDALQTTPYKFAGKHGFNRASIFNMIKGSTRPNLDMLERICIAEPSISAEYLVRGEGSPLREVSSISSDQTIQQLRAFQSHIYQFIEERIHELE